MANDYGLPPNNALSAWLGVRDSNNRQSALNTQNMAGQIGILGALQQQALRRKAMEDEAVLREAVQSGDPNRIAATPGGIGILKQLAEIENAKRTGALRDAQMGALQRKAVTGQRQEMASNELSQELLKPSDADALAKFGFKINPETGGLVPIPGATPNMEGMPGFTPLTVEAQNPDRVRALAVQAGPMGQSVLRGMPREGQQVPRIAPREVQDPNSPTGWSWFDPTTQRMTPGAPVPGTVIGQTNADLRRRSIDYQVGGGGGIAQPATQPAATPTEPTPRPVPPAVEDAIRKQTSAKVVKALEENYVRLRDAPQQLDSIESAKKLIPDASVFQGPLGETKLFLAKFFNSNTPIKIDVSGVNSAEELRTRVFMNVMDNLKKMDAQPSQLQQQIMQRALGDLGTDPNALSKMLDAYGDAIRDKVTIYQGQVKEAEDAGVRWPHKINVKTRANAPASTGWSIKPLPN